MTALEVPTINYHLKEIYKSGELTEEATIRKIRIVQTEGKRQVGRELDFYHLKAILAVGYRVNSNEATHFRQWATNTLNEFVTKVFVLDKELIETKSSTTVAKVIPQKGVFVEVGDRVLVGIVKPSNRKGYYEDFENGCAQLYYTGAMFPSTIALHNLHFFIPYFKDMGIRDVYEIVKIRTIKGSEAKQLEGVDEQTDDIRLAFELKFSRRLFEECQKIRTNGMVNYSFIDTTFDGLEELVIKD